MSRAFEETLAVVVGATTGVGGAIVEALLAAGANVAAVDDLEPRFPSIGSHDARRCLVFGADVQDERAMEGVLAELAGAPLRHLFNVVATKQTGSVLETAAGEWDDAFACCLRGAFLVCKQTIPVIAANGGGSLINVAATGLARGRCAVEVAAQAALEALTCSMAVDHAGQGLDVRWLGPSFPRGSRVAAVRSPGAAALPALPSRVSPPGSPTELAAAALRLAAERVGR